MTKRVAIIGCLLLAAVAVFLATVRPKSLRIVDERFEVLACKYSTQATHEMCDGNQLVERLNGWVKKKWGVNLTKRVGLSVSGPTHAILLRYRGRIDSDSLDYLKAFMSTDEGEIELQSLGRYLVEDRFIKAFHLTVIPTNHGPVSVSFKLPNGEEMAVWNIKRFL